MHLNDSSPFFIILEINYPRKQRHFGHTGNLVFSSLNTSRVCLVFTIGKDSFESFLNG